MDILYPYALNSCGQITHIDKATSSEQYTCLNCKTLMLPKQGEERAWHYAHKSDEVSCSGESALHGMAKRLIVDIHSKGNLTIVNWQCPHCGMHCQHDFTGLRSSIETVWHRFRPDVAFWNPDNSLNSVIEVVVSNLSEEAKQEYAEYHIPCFVWNVTWGIIRLPNPFVFTVCFNHKGTYERLRYCKPENSLRLHLLHPKSHTLTCLGCGLRTNWHNEPIII